MTPIVNFYNRMVCWLDGENVFSNDGLPVALIRRDAIFAAKDCALLGQFEDGVFRDRLGCIVASVPGKWWCRGQTLREEALKPPSIQFFQLPECASQTAAPYRLTEPLMSRSTLTWECFIRGDEARQPWKTRR